MILPDHRALRITMEYTNLALQQFRQASKRVTAAQTAARMHVWSPASVLVAWQVPSAFCLLPSPVLSWHLPLTPACPP